MRLTWFGKKTFTTISTLEFIFKLTNLNVSIVFYQRLWSKCSFGGIKMAIISYATNFSVR